ncbi:alpha/beta hydrolase [soil metagenome]
MTDPRLSDLADWQQQQQARRVRLWSLLGDLPAPKPPRAQLIKTERHEGFTLEHLLLDLNDVEPVAAYLLIPDERAAVAPGLLYIHAHGGTYDIGKEELLLGREVLPAYAPVCAAKGLVTLAIDSCCFSSRQRDKDGARGEADTFKHLLWQGQVLFGRMIFDEFQALTYLAGRPEVDPQRLGVFGISMGATKAWWLAALDSRIKLCVDLCCLTDFEELIRIGNLSGHGIYYYVPSLRKHFEAADINALIAPRPRLSLNGRHDLLTPPAGVSKIEAEVAPHYARLGRSEDCRIELFDCGHEETPAMRKLVLEWFDRYLVK